MPALFRRCMMYPSLSVAAICVALMLAVPFVLPFNTLPVPTFYQEWTAVALGCAALLAIILAHEQSGIEVPRIALLPVGILVLLLVQLALGRLVYWQQGAVGAMYLLWSIAMLCVGRTLRQRLGWERFCKLAAWAVCAGALASAVVGVLQLVGWKMGGMVMPMIGPRVHANLGQANHFAAYLFFGLISTVYLVTVRRMHVFAAVGAMVFLLVLANYSGSRSIWLYVAAGLLLALLTRGGERSRQTRTLLFWAAAGIVTLLAVQLISVSLLEISTLRLSAGARLSAADTGTSHRQIIWLASLLMFKSAAFAGVGFNGFAWNYFVSAGQLPAGIPGEITDNAHNLILQLLAEFGLPGGIILIGSGVVWWVAQLRERLSIHRWWLLSLVSIISLHSLLEYPLWYAYFLGPFALLVGAGDNAVWHFSRASVSRLSVAGLCIVIVWLLASVFYDYRSVERLGSVAHADLKQSATRRDAISASGSSLFANFVELGLSRTIKLDRNELAAKLELNGRVLRAFPAGDVAYRQSALHALNGDFATAYKLWDLAVTVYPGQAADAATELALNLSMGEERLGPLVEYAASRNGLTN